MIRWLWTVTLVVSLGFLQPGATPVSRNSDLAVVIYDATASSDCQLSVQTDDGPPEPMDCPVGTIVAAEVVPASDVGNYPGATILTIEQSQDVFQPSVDGAAGVLSRQERGVNRASACGAHWRTVNGSYAVGGGSGRTYYTMSYYMDGDCFVSSIQDRAMTNYAGLVTWNRSCSNGLGGSCSSRGIILSNSYTGYYGLPLSFYDAQYVNVSTFGGGGTTYYGFWYFD